MTATAVRFRGARVLTGDAVVPGWLDIVDGRIDAVGSGEPEGHHPNVHDLAGRWLAPGFVDVHCHGGGGASFQSGEADAARTAVALHRRHGTTSILASLVTAPIDQMVTSVGRLADAVESGLLAGIHLEGPFLSQARCGAHDPALLLDPDAASLDALLAAGRGCVSMVTLAPERPGGLEAVARLVRFGVVAAVGHTDADHELTQAAIELGASVGTHLFNGMPPLHHRAPGPALALLDDPRVVLELINDGVHLDPAIVRHVFAAAPSRVALVTDAIALAGAGDGELSLGDQPVVVSGGVARLADGGSLAGSGLTLDVALRNAVAAGVSVPEAVRAVTATPADAVGIGDRCGRLRPGASADLVVLDEGLHVREVWIRGSRQP